MWVYHNDKNHTSLPLVQYLFYDNHHKPNGYKTKINLSPIMLLQSQSNHVTSVSVQSRYFSLSPIPLLQSQSNHVALASIQSCCFSLNPKSHVKLLDHRQHPKLH